MLLVLVFHYDPGFQEDPSQPFSDSDDDVNDTDGQFQKFVFLFPAASTLLKQLNNLWCADCWEAVGLLCQVLSHPTFI